jgi:hypothetical protein
MDKTSLFEVLGLPAPFGVVLLTFSFILLLAPYFSGTDFGLFKIPTFTLKARKWLKILGPVLFFLCALSFIRLFQNDKATDTESNVRVAKLSVTKLSGAIERVELSQQRGGDVQVFILMSIANEGQQPTRVQQYSLRISHVSSKSIDVKGLRPLEIKDRITLLKNRATLPLRAGNKDNLIIQPRDAIVSRTAIAVPIGGKESGWMWFKLPLLTPTDLSQPGIIYTVSFADVNSTMYEASYQVR